MSDKEFKQFYITDDNHASVFNEKVYEPGEALRQAFNTHLADKANPHDVTAEQIGAETPASAQAKADQAEQNAKTYADQQIGQLAQDVAQNTQDIADVSQDLDAHLAESAIHKTSDVIRTETNTQLKVEVVSSSVSETPDAGRIIFDTSQGKFFGGTGTGWV